ncbi:MAG: DUF599 domain-containing protein [Yoonia sp.]|jgi:uncharacterized membrane protein|nr:DUF599 domain-containing protein [Yoonia sp.]MDG1520728.1 DUF599 domain-containing protein [Yoonia sp.]MDG1769633.1 DUF599 domain-containing protein [Yoonia sp.]MDG1868521.1 DUF599 domain-containing protein [Yoonia sp.]
MNMLDLVILLQPLDWAASIYIVSMWLILSYVIEHPPKSRPSVTVLMSQRRRDWMHVFVHRDPRIFDSQILASLRQGTSFFASTCIFAIGGVLALAKNTDPLVGVAQEVTAVTTPALIIQMKLAFVALFLTNAFLKFVWANRVFGYCAVMMAAVPNDPNDPGAHPKAQQAAELNIRAAMNFNRGLRALYFALGALAWLLGPVPLMIAATVVIWVVWSREFASIPRDILVKDIS